MGAKYTVDGYKSLVEPTESDNLNDDLGEPSAAWVPIPEAIATALRVRLEAEPPEEAHC